MTSSSSGRHRGHVPSPCWVERVRRACAGPFGPHSARTRGRVAMGRDPSGPATDPPPAPVRSAPFPQRCGRVDSVGALTPRSHPGQSVGDQGRLVEKLSPGMCTGWGDLVPAGSRDVTTHRSGRGPRASIPVRTSVLPARSPEQRRRGHLSQIRRPVEPFGTPAHPGDRTGRQRGQGVERRRPRCTTVVLSTCRQQGSADHPQRTNRPIRALSSTKGSDPQLPHL